MKKKIVNNAEGYAPQESDHRVGHLYRDAYAKLRRNELSGVLSSLTIQQGLVSVEISNKLKDLKNGSEVDCRESCLEVERKLIT